MTQSRSFSHVAVAVWLLYYKVTVYMVTTGILIDEILTPL